MPLPTDQRARLLEIQEQGLKYADFASAAVADATKAGVRVDYDVRYALLAAATSCLDRDDRELERQGRAREVRATVLLAVVVAIATVVQAAAAVMSYRDAPRPPQLADVAPLVAPPTSTAGPAR